MLREPTVFAVLLENIESLISTFEDKMIEITPDVRLKLF